MPILYPSAIKAKRAFLMSGVASMTLMSAQRFFCPSCGEGNLYRDVPCAGCGEALPNRKAA